MQLGILIEEMRREGYEMSLSPPSVVKTTGLGNQCFEYEQPNLRCDSFHAVQPDTCDLCTFFSLMDPDSC